MPIFKTPSAQKEHEQAVDNLKTAQDNHAETTKAVTVAENDVKIKTIELENAQKADIFTIGCLGAAIALIGTIIYQAIKMFLLFLI